MALEDARAGQAAIDQDAWYESRQTILERCPKKHLRTYRIHPSIGIARVGNSPDQYFLGAENDSSEVPGRFFTLPADRSKLPVETQIAASAEKTIFKDRQSKRDQPISDRGRVRRQAARFRIIEYMTCKPGRGKEPDWKWTREITSDEAKITWSVEVANKKATFFKVIGRQLDPGQMRGGSSKPTVEPGKKKLTVRRGFDPAKHGATHVVLEDKGKLVDYLGEIHHDAKGRLVFLGGRGLAKGPGRADEAFNNDGWVDDVSDGEVNATLDFPGKGQRYDTKKGDGNAWVIVGPPDFAPEITNVVSLYDMMMDLAVYGPMTPTADNKITYDMHGVTDRKDVKFLPHVEHDLLRLLRATVETAAVFAPANPRMKHPAVYKLANNTHLDDALETPASVAAGIAPNEHLRYKVFNTLRPQDPSREVVIAPPKLPVSTDPRVQEEALKRYETFRRTMPYMPSDDDTSTGFPVTQLQYEICVNWYFGYFGDTTFETFAGIPRSTAITPAGLDRAALDHTVGGPFYPGIEVSWLSRSPEIYSAPFRVKRGNTAKEIEYGLFKSIGVDAAGVKVEPGFFTQQMAQPWHTDFYDCSGSRYAWWPANRPIDVVRGDVSAADPDALMGPTPIRRDGRTLTSFELGGTDALLMRTRNITITLGGAKPRYGAVVVTLKGTDESRNKVTEELKLAPGLNQGSRLYAFLEKMTFAPAALPEKLDATLAVGTAAGHGAPDVPTALLWPTAIASKGDSPALDPAGNTSLARSRRRLLFTLDGPEATYAPQTVIVSGTDEDDDHLEEIVPLPRGPGTARSKNEFASVSRVTYLAAAFPEDLPAETTIGFGEFVGDMLPWMDGIADENDNVEKWWRLGFVLKGVEIERDPNLDPA